MTAYRFASAAGGAGPEGGSPDAGDREHVTEPRLRGRILDYLRGAAPLPEPYPGYRTDGVWIWPEGVEGDLLNHNLAPEPGLLATMRYHGFHCPPVTVRMGDEAADALRARLARESP